MPGGPTTQLAVALFDNFSGGLNIRDAPSELAENESPWLQNVTFDERGGVVARLGFSQLNGGSLLPAAPQRLYYSENCDAILAYLDSAGSGRLYKSTDGGVSWSSVYAGFTAGARAGMVDFNNRLVVANSLDGVYSFPANLGAPTHTAGGTNNMDQVRGSAVTVWQNKLWVGGDGRFRSRLWWSAAGDELTWPIATNFNDLREIDDQLIIATGVGQGVDAQNKPALFVAKHYSCYRVNDSTTGSYTTLHSGGAGCASHASVTSVLGKIIFANDRGVWVTDGIQIPVRVSDRLTPLFTGQGINLGALSTWQAAPKLETDTVVFAIARSGSSVPNQLLEYDPDVGWFTRHTFPVGAMCPYTRNAKKLIGASPTTGAVYDCFRGGADAGSPFDAYWQSRWVQSYKGATGRLRRCRAWGRGAVNFNVLTEFTQGAGDAYGLNWPSGGGGFSWDTDAWNQGNWSSGVLQEGDMDLALDEAARYYSVKVGATVSNSTTGPPILGDGGATELGNWGMYVMRLEFIPLS